MLMCYIDLFGQQVCDNLFFYQHKKDHLPFWICFWCVQFDFLSEWKIFLSYPISLTCCSLNHIIHWELYKTSSFWISSFSCSKLLCVVVWYCKTKLNPCRNWKPKKTIPCRPKKKEEVILNFCTIPVCSVAWLRGPVFIFHLKISMTAISTLFWHQILKRLLNNLRRRKITLAKFFFTMKHLKTWLCLGYLHYACLAQTGQW